MRARLRAASQRIQDVGRLFEIAVFVGILYVAYIAPMVVIRGDAEHARDYAAAAIGLAFWVLALGSFSEILR